MKKVEIFFLLFLWLQGCFPARPQPVVVQENDAENSATTAFTDTSSTDEKILFLILQMQKDSTAASGENCVLTEKKIIPGHLKQPLKPNEFINPGDLLFSIKNDKNEAVFVKVEEDPITASTEYPNDDGSFGRVFLSPNTADIVLRFPFSSELSHIDVGKVRADKSIIHIATIYL